jgi:predicted metal-dependent hydrolase
VAFKQFELEGIGPLKVYKRRGTRNIRLSVDHAGKVRVSIPTWLPYKTGLSYAVSKQGWLTAQLATHAQQLYANGQSIGKQHVLYFEPTTNRAIRTSRKSEQIIIYYPDRLSVTDNLVQAAAGKAAVKALRHEAEQHLPERLQDLANLHDFSFKSVSIRQLKSRWGSCDQDKNIKLNLYLMQLPWELIDYVLLHELVHTRIMQHGPVFWRAMAELQPETPLLRKQIRGYKTAILQQMPQV